MDDLNVIPIRQSKQQKQIVALIKKFPGFAGIVPAHILADFDASAFDQWASSTPISKGELIIARFVLGVWDSYVEWQCGKFDLFEAVGIFDSGNRQVLYEWVKDPFFV